MSYLPPFMRLRRHPDKSLFLKPGPLTAPEDIAAERLKICEACANHAAGRCRLFGCCEKPVAQTVTMALRSCPAGKWPRWVPEAYRFLITQPPGDPALGKERLLNHIF